MNNSIIGKRGVTPTNAIKKISFGGKLQEFKVYRVNLKYLFYNDKNDRVATWMSQHVEENGELYKDNLDEYNEIVEQFIINSNSSAFTRTKDNIHQIGQREAGVILNDGRVIDGNRRFTCLRKIFEESNAQEFEYFETIIVDGDVDDKEIKILELDLQHGIDEKVDYNPIDKLVGVYNDVIKKKVLTDAEYAKHINITNSQMKMMIEKANLMVDFLDFIKAKEKFYIARDMELDGPLQEIANIRKKYKDEDEWDEVKVILYSYMVAKPKGDITRVIRDIGKILNSKKGDKFIEDNEEIAEEIYDAIPQGVISSQAIRTAISKEKNLLTQMTDSIDEYKDKANIETIKEKPIKILQKAENHLSEIDVDVIRLLSISEKLSIEEILLRMKYRIEDLEVILDVK